VPRTTITNLTHGSWFTPLLVAAHDPGTELFHVGDAASAELRAMAEGGDISGLEAAVDGAGGNRVSNPAGGLLAPGESTTTELLTDAANTQLSITAMLLPTNDGFVGIDSLTLPTAPGTYTWYLSGYDAGTEANDELITGGGAPGAPGIPADPGGAEGSNDTGAAGADANATIHVHRGVLGDSDPNGGPSDLDSSVHRWLNPVARLVVTVN